MPEPVLSPDELNAIDAYWRAANYVSVGQIYLLDNPLLREPLEAEHIKPRLLGHWGTTPGLNLLYAHMNRAIRQRDLDAIYITGPGHGGPGLVANAYLEGTYSEVYSSISPDQDGLRALFRQFSFPGGIPSHVAPETPGSIHEGGELGYALVHAYGAVAHARLRVRAALRRRGRARGRPPETGDHPRLGARRDRVHPGSCPRRRRPHPPGLADDRAAYPQGMDGAEAGRRRPGRGDVPLAPGATLGDAHERRAPRHARGVAAQLPARRAVRRLRPAGARRAARPPR